MKVEDFSTESEVAERAAHVRGRLPPEGLFAGQTWRISPNPFPLEPGLVSNLEELGRVLLQFYRAANLLYRLSAAGKQPGWIAGWMDQGKPKGLLDLARADTFKNELPRVLRPDILLTERGPMVSELDSIPGGIGVTAWLNRVYGELGFGVVGGGEGMLGGFGGLFGDAVTVRIVISEESETYKPEMIWLSQQLGPQRFRIEGPEAEGVRDGDAVYRFFELFDLQHVPGAASLFALAKEGRITLTPPPKPFLEEKMLFALFWNRHLQEFWRQQLGAGFVRRLQRLLPYTWLIDPTPLPPQGAFPILNLNDWRQLKGLSQKERNLILKISGFSETAWGARSVFLGCDLSSSEWGVAVDRAIAGFGHHPYVLQEFHKPKRVDFSWFDFERQQLNPFSGRVRLCPYYFVHGDGDAARARLGGVLATICPANKKIIHGMPEAVLAPCMVAGPEGVH